MSWDFYKNKTVKARKEYTCEWVDHLELSDIINTRRKGQPDSINVAQCKEYGISDDEIKVLQQYVADNYIIQKGEIHYVTTGKVEGMWMECRTKMAISDIVHKYDLASDD
jgi:hypothetical protein